MIRGFHRISRMRWVPFPQRIAATASLLQALRDYNLHTIGTPGTSARHMLKGTRDGILKRVQPVSIHGQVSWDVFFTDLDDTDGQTHVARMGPEAVALNIEPGDRIQIEYVVGVAIRVSRVVPGI